MSEFTHLKKRKVPRASRSLAVDFIESYIEKGGKFEGEKKAEHEFEATEYGLGTIVKFNLHSLISNGQEPDSSLYHHAVMPIDILHTITPMVGVVTLVDAQRSFVGFNTARGFRRNSTAFIIEHGGVQDVESITRPKTTHITFFDEPLIVRHAVIGQPDPVQNRQ